jgi:hypothetical protein
MEGKDYRDQGLWHCEWVATGLSVEEILRIDPMIVGSNLLMLELSIAEANGVV